MSARSGIIAIVVLVAAALGTGSSWTNVARGAEGETAEWRLVQVNPPEPPPGVGQAPGPVPLGRIGDIRFEAPNRGVLITAGNTPTVKPGVWEYNGEAWHELSEVCGGTDGRIAWAGPEEFWTISDGRPGQALVNGQPPPLEDNTLCRFSNPNHAGEPLRVMESFAFPAFQADSYQAMHAAACLSSTDCWFAGEHLPSESIEAGSFHLHWNGHTLVQAPYPAEGHSVEDMAAFEGRLFESVRLQEEDRDEVRAPRPPVLHAVNPEGVTPTFEGLASLPLYGSGEFSLALDFLHLSAGAELLWAAAGPQKTPEGSSPGQVTIVRGSGLATGEGAWTQVVGPEAPVNKEQFAGQTVTAIAAEPAGDSALVALDSPVDIASPSPSAYAHIARVSAQVTQPIEGEQTIPTAAEPSVGPKGAASKLVCPAADDCWLATTQGWLFHLSTAAEETLARDPDPAFDTLVTERPIDQGLPQTPPDTVPADTSGLPEFVPPVEGAYEQAKAPEQRATVPLVTNLHTKLVHGTTLELRFHLAVKARIRLLAKRAKQVVAATAMRTFAPGNRSLALRLNRKRWPTKLQLQSHALAPLPTVPAGKPSNESVVSTSLAFPAVGARAGLGLLP